VTAHYLQVLISISSEIQSLNLKNIKCTIHLKNECHTPQYSSGSKQPVGNKSYNKNFITDLQGAIDFDAIVPVVNYNHETIDRIFCPFLVRSAITVSRVKTEFARRDFRFAAPQIWNVLSVNVQSSQSVHVFKSRLKTFLFNRASI